MPANSGIFRFITTLNNSLISGSDGPGFIPFDPSNLNRQNAALQSKSDLDAIGGLFKSNGGGIKSRKYKSRKHKSRKYKSRKHKSRKHKSRKYKSRKYKSRKR